MKVKKKIYREFGITFTETVTRLYVIWYIFVLMLFTPVLVILDVVLIPFEILFVIAKHYAIKKEKIKGE